LSPPQLRLILPDLTAIGVGLRHASRTPPSRRGRRGARLRNTWLTYPWDGDNPGKLGLIPDRRGCLEWFLAEKAPEPCFRCRPRMGPRPIRLLVG